MQAADLSCRSRIRPEILAARCPRQPPKVVHPPLGMPRDRFGWQTAKDEAKQGISVLRCEIDLD
jgi:hypothetical protein